MYFIIVPNTCKFLTQSHFFLFFLLFRYLWHSKKEILNLFLFSVFIFYYRLSLSPSLRWSVQNKVSQSDKPGGKECLDISAQTCLRTSLFYFVCHIFHKFPCGLCVHHPFWGARITWQQDNFNRTVTDQLNFVIAQSTTKWSAEPMVQVKNKCCNTHKNTHTHS